MKRKLIKKVKVIKFTASLSLIESLIEIRKDPKARKLFLTLLTRAKENEWDLDNLLGMLMMSSVWKKRKV